MPKPMLLDKRQAVFLAHCCQETYSQYRNNGDFNIPQGYQLVHNINARTVAGNQEIFGYIIQSRRNIILAFRGTQSTRDWLSDADILQTEYPYNRWGGRTHAGFTTIYNSCREEILDRLQMLPSTANLFITGHSLGGALAVLSALDVASNTHYNPVMYSFAGPRVGDPRFALTYHRLVPSTMRVVNVYDIVPRVPPEFIRNPLKHQVMHYRHVANEFHISVNRFGVSRNHHIQTYIDGLNRLE